MGNFKKATFGGGCFWCLEAVFQQINGVESVISGYAGGKVANPSYREVCYGRTGHAEVVQITYDEDIISYQELLEIFWTSHDPTTLNRQGADVGTQYRSIILYHNEEQKDLAISYKNKLNQEKAFDDPVVTEIEALKTFYPATADHQDYYNSNTEQPYCSI
ncbi:MAG: peptide-methionine (S)-S-oxide reductase MsrA, partial [Fulvivirga sp.]|nr:peptide-methionine (S)-S-oxide reductase MsrA [Fulvivirga sp.]